MPLPAYMSEHAAGADSVRGRSRRTDAAARRARARADRLLDRAAARLRSADPPAQRARDAQRRDLFELARHDRRRLSRTGARACWRISVRNRSSIRRGDRIAQMVVAPVSRAAFEDVDELPPSRARRGRLRFDRRACDRVKIYIVGKGAVGTYFGELLSSVGVEVAYAPRALADVRDPYDADVAIVTTKSYDTDRPIETLRRAIAHPEKCVFVSPQNGVGNEEKLAEAFGADNVVAAALTMPVGRDRDGNVRLANDGGLALAPMGANAYNWLVATFAGTGLNVKVVDDWRALKWSKLALNVVANASCAILNVLPNRLVHFEKVFTLEIRMIREVRAVMQAMEITPDRLAALSGARAVQRREPAEPGRARAAGAQHRGRARNESAVAAARPARRQAADRGRRAQRRRRRGRPRLRRSDAGQRDLLPRARRHRAYAAAVGEVPRTSRTLEAEVVAEMKRVKALARAPSLRTESCAIRTFPNRSKAGGFSTGCLRSTGAVGRAAGETAQQVRRHAVDLGRSSQDRATTATSGSRRSSATRAT